MYKTLSGDLLSKDLTFKSNDNKVLENNNIDSRIVFIDKF